MHCFHFARFLYGHRVEICWFLLEFEAAVSNRPPNFVTKIYLKISTLLCKIHIETRDVMTKLSFVYEWIKCLYEIQCFMSSLSRKKVVTKPCSSFFIIFKWVIDNSIVNYRRGCISVDCCLPNFAFAARSTFTIKSPGLWIHVRRSCKKQWFLV